MPAPSITLFISIIIASILPPILLKHHSLMDDNEKGAKILMIVFTIFSLTAIFFFYIELFNGNEVGKYYAIVKIVTVILVFLYGFLFLEEVISCTKILGIILGVLSIYLLTL